ncbi:MAG: hypothetical protein ACT4OF_03565 [Caulobacteraceae bacterium]
MTSIGRVLAAAAVVTLMAAPAYAQQINSRALGTFGQVSLRSGFTPDPHTTSVNAGGPIDVSTVSDRCAGFIAERPSFTLNYRAGDLPLYVGVVADADTTLVVRGPNRQYMCDDDSGDDLNPVISWDNPRSGRYQIWVGRFGTGDLVPAQLIISEIGGPANELPTDLPDFTLNPNYGTIDLVSGFQPDPHTVSVSAGGDYNAYAIPGCVGWVSRAPDYRVNWTAGSGALPLVFSVQSDADTTLVINDTSGNWVCDDDGGNNGLNPAVTFANPPSGQYDIWVGTFSEGAMQPSTLNVSELYAQ